MAKATGLTIQTVLKPQEVAPLFSAAPALQYSVTRKGGGTVDCIRVRPVLPEGAGVPQSAVKPLDGAA